jgi:iron complex outermembrane receptor protein
VEERLPDAYKLSIFDSTAISKSINLADLLDNNSTVFVKSYGSGSLASVSFRGTGASHTSVLWNDVVLNSPMNGQIDFSLFPTPFFSEASLNYGASGLINGNGALGGSVNLFSKPVFNKGLSYSINQSLGSFGNIINSESISYSNEKWYLKTDLYFNQIANDFEYVNTSSINQDIVKQKNAELSRYGIQQTIFTKLKSGHLGLRFWYLDNKRNLPGNMLSNDDNLSQVENQKDRSFRGVIEWKGFKNKFSYKTITAILRDELIYDNPAASILSQSTTQTLDNKLKTKFFVNNGFILRNDIDIRYETASADGLTENQKRFNNYWLFGIEKNMNDLDINLFNRMVMVGEEFESLSPSLGLRYSLLKNKSLKVKANTAINYSYPSFNDLYWSVGGNADLEPEKSEMIDIGLAYGLKTKHLTLSNEITGFYNYVNNWIIWLPGANNIWSPENLKEVESKGLEYSLRISKKSNNLNLSASINYSYNLSTNKAKTSTSDDSFNKQLIYVPYHQLNYSVGAASKGFNLLYNFNYTGQRFMTTDNNWYMPANFISNVFLSKSIKIWNKSQFEFGIDIRNLFDQQYQAIAWRAMPGRNYLFTLKLKHN